MNNVSAASITAVVIAGGLSTRMNSDKALLRWRDRLFIEHIVARLTAQIGPQGVLAINTNQPSDELKTISAPLLPDPFPDRRGPLGGILAGLNFSQTALTLFVPCDNPILPEDLLPRLLAALRKQDTAIAYAFCGDDHHYLYALMRSDVRTDLSRFLQNDNFAVRRWYAAVGATPVDFSDVSASFLNINNPADLARLPPIA